MQLPLGGNLHIIEQIATTGQGKQTSDQHGCVTMEHECSIIRHLHECKSWKTGIQLVPQIGNLCNYISVFSMAVVTDHRRHRVLSRHRHQLVHLCAPPDAVKKLYTSIMHKNHDILD